MKNPHFINLYPELLDKDLHSYRAVHLHGVRDLNQESDSEIQCVVDDENPGFFSVYVRHQDGTCVVCADASLDRLDGLRAFAQRLADQHHWSYQDFTRHQAYWVCKQCKVKAHSVYGIGLCLSCYGEQPHLGSKIVSLFGETADTDAGQDVFTGANAEGVVGQILPDQEHCYSVLFPKEVSVFLSLAEITDKGRYRILKKHDVHLYAIVRVKVSGVEAAGHAEAIKLAEASVDLSALFDNGAGQEFTGELDGYCVDETGDEEYVNTRWYQIDGITLQ
ncbi:MAG: hypothetical protein CTY16_12555 [Methylobacter sp.]|nr:MAG: hypothetical protein CTY16_12555 [Methylobacter sp.]